MEKVSIIVPAYNAEKTLHCCVDSILRQSYKNIEIIIVDDGSTDNTFHVATELQKSDSRIVLKKKTNGGVSSARNLGIRSATGKYIAFVDADDKVKPKMIEAMLNASDADIVVSGFYQEIAGNVSNAQGAVLRYDILKIKREFADFYKIDFFNSVWGKLYKIQMIEDIWFDETARIGEDLLFNLEVFKQVKEVAIIKYQGYMYIENIKSATHKFDTSDFEQQKVLRNAANEFGISVFSERETCIEAIDSVYLRNIADIIVNLITLKNGLYVKEKLNDYLRDEYYMELLKKYKIHTLPIDRKRQMILGLMKYGQVKLLQVIGKINRIRNFIKSACV